MDSAISVPWGVYLIKIKENSILLINQFVPEPHFGVGPSWVLRKNFLNWEITFLRPDGGWKGRIPKVKRAKLAQLQGKW
jgi:hypothetical protein